MSGGNNLCTEMSSLALAASCMFNAFLLSMDNYVFFSVSVCSFFNNFSIDSFSVDVICYLASLVINAWSSVSSDIGT